MYAGCCELRNCCCYDYLAIMLVVFVFSLVTEFVKSVILRDEVFIWNWGIRFNGIVFVGLLSVRD